MRTNIFKYLFFLIVVLLIGISIYMVYKDKKSNNANIELKKSQIEYMDHLNIGIVGYDNINPILSNNRDIQYINKLIFEPLVDITYDFRIENKLAKEFSNINGTTHIIKLKEDIYWHDGNKFTADDVLFTINNIKNSNIKSIYKENVEKIKETKKIDEYTIKIFLEEEVPFFEYKMCFPVLAAHSYEEKTLESITRLPIGTGKYKIEEISKDLIKISLVDKNSKNKIIDINLIIKEFPKDLYDAFKKNEVDYIITDNIEYEKYIGTIGYNIKQIKNREHEYLIFNVENDNFLNKEVRKAISYAIDKKNINYNVYNNKYIECEFPLDYDSYLYSKNKMNEYNVTEAKQILLKDNWINKNGVLEKNNKKLEVKLLVDSVNEKRILVAELIKEQLNKIGIDVKVIEANNISYLNYIKNKNYDIILLGNKIANFPNLETYFSENNLSNYRSEKIKILLKEIKTINDEKILADKYSNIEKIYIEEKPFISLYFNSLFIISNNKLKGDLSCNWYNLFYNIDSWYKIQ